MTDTTLASEEWWNGYQEIVKEDPEMTLHGRDAFDENFVVGIGGEQFLIDMQGGEVQDVRTPGLDDAWAFGVIGEREAWKQFVEEVPPAHHNEVFASFYRTASRVKKGTSTSSGTTRRYSRTFGHFSGHWT